MSVQPPHDLGRSAPESGGFWRESGPARPHHSLRPRGRRLWLLLAAGLLVFLLASAWLARFLSTENAERDAIYSLLRAQAAGNAQAMLGRLSGCGRERSCLANVRYDARQERAGGGLQILALSSPTAYSLSQAKGETRVAWRSGSDKPVVQCVVVERRGSAITGLSIVLRSISAPIPNEADCPPGSKPPPAEEPEGEESQ